MNIRGFGYRVECVSAVFWWEGGGIFKDLKEGWYVKKSMESVQAEAGQLGRGQSMWVLGGHVEFWS